MNHKELIANITPAGNTVSKTAVDGIYKALAGVIADQLKTNGSITLQGIGTISVADTAARKGRNPQTGEEIDIPAGKRIKLKAAKVLNDAVA